MTRYLMRIRRGLCGRLRQDESGFATLEFVVLFPLLILFLTIAFETGVLATRQSMLDSAVNVAMRDLRLGTSNPPTHQQLKERICEVATIIPDCVDSVMIELSPISMVSWDINRSPVDCIDRAADVEPVMSFTPGQSNELMLVRVCVLFEPINPAAGLALDLDYINDNEYALLSTSAFVNEP